MSQMVYYHCRDKSFQLLKMTFLNHFLTLVMGVILGFITAHFAVRKGRDPLIWFIIGLFFGFLGLIVLYFLQPTGFTPSVDTAQTEKNEPPAVPLLPVTETLPAAWYYMDKFWQMQGPVSLDQLKSLFVRNEVSVNTPVWSETMHDWKSVKDLEMLLKFLEKK